jgi:hypothetical protein
MVPVCPGTATPVRTTNHPGGSRESGTRLRRIALAALLAALGLLPIFLEVVAAFERHPAESKSALLASRKTLDFGVRPVGAQTPVVMLAIANSSEVDVRISKVAIAGDHADDFTLVKSTCENLAPNATCTVTARFTPKAVGARSARIVVSGAKAAALEVPLVGKGLDPSERQRTRRSTRYR